MSSAAAAIPLFGDAYLADTRHLSLEEHGAYLQLMMIAWRIDGCCLPDDDSRLSRMLGVTAAKWKKLKPVVMAFWTMEDGAWRQGRLSKERKFVEEKRAKNKASAEARWTGQATENKGGDVCERISERNAPPPPPRKKVQDATHPSPRAGNQFPRPEWADKQVWADFMANRKAKRFPSSATAYAKFLSDLARWQDSEWPPPRLLEHAAGKGWGGIYNPREEDLRGHPRQPTTQQSNGLRGTRPDPSLDLLRAAEAEERAERDQAAYRGAGTEIPALRTG